MIHVKFVFLIITGNEAQSLKVEYFFKEILKSKSYVNLKVVYAYSEVLQELFSISVNEESEEVNFTFTGDLIFINIKLLKNEMRISFLI